MSLWRRPRTHAAHSQSSRNDESNWRNIWISYAQGCDLSWTYSNVIVHAQGCGLSWTYSNVIVHDRSQPWAYGDGVLLSDPSSFGCRGSRPKHVSNPAWRSLKPHLNYGLIFLFINNDKWFGVSRLLHKSRQLNAKTGSTNPQLNAKAGSTNAKASIALFLLYYFTLSCPAARETTVGWAVGLGGLGGLGGLISMSTLLYYPTPYVYRSGQIKMPQIKHPDRVQLRNLFRSRDEFSIYEFGSTGDFSEALNSRYIYYLPVIYGICYTIYLLFMRSVIPFTCYLWGPQYYLRVIYKYYLRVIYKVCITLNASWTEWLHATLVSGMIYLRVWLGYLYGTCMAQFPSHTLKPSICPAWHSFQVTVSLGMCLTWVGDFTTASASMSWHILDLGLQYTAPCVAVVCGISLIWVCSTSPCVWQ